MRQPCLDLHLPKKHQGNQGMLSSLMIQLSGLAYGGREQIASNLPGWLRGDSRTALSTNADQLCNTIEQTGMDWGMDWAQDVPESKLS